MKSSKRKRCTTNEGLVLAVPNDKEMNRVIMSKHAYKNAADHESHQSETQLISDNNEYFRSDASSPFLVEEFNKKMEPPNICLQQSFLINNSSLKQQMFSFNETKQINENRNNDFLNQVPKTSITSSHQFYNHQSSIVAAISSSYYSLTPASSTTSLNDLNLYNTNKNENKKTLLTKKKQSASNLIRTGSTKRKRTITVENLLNQQLTTTTTTSAQSVETVVASTEQVAAQPVRRRGRPPKNLTTAKSQSNVAPIAEPEPVNETIIKQEVKTTTLVRHNTIDSTVYARNPSSNKLIKSLINKCSSNSNLQKSKVAETAPSEQSVLTNKSNTNVNTKPQPQITEYLVDNNNKQDNLSDIENQHVKKPTVLTNKLSTTNLNTQEDPFPSTPMPKLSWANNNELWQVMRRKEVKYIHDPNYLKRHLNIEPQMRAILLDWLVEISYAYRLHRETWYLALEYMDRFLTCSKQQMRVDRLQLIGMSSLFLAAKVEEIYPPKLKELAAHMESYSTNNEDAISQFELFMLKTLNWEISPVTANTWLMTYLQIASINYYSIMNQDGFLDKMHNTNMVMPLNIYKNSNLSKFGLDSANNENGGVSPVQQQFYLENYMKSVTLLDLCMFDMESLRFSYSVLAASAMYHMISPLSSSTNQNQTPLNRANNQQAAILVQSCTGYKLYELDACIKWMYPYADVCKDILTEEKMIQIKNFSNIDFEDCHNIQLYYQNLELLKEVQSRKTPSKFYSNSNLQILLTPPDSHRKFSSSSSSASCSYVSDSNNSTFLSNHTVLSTPASVSQNSKQK